MLIPKPYSYGQAGMDQNDSTVSKGGIAITVDVNMPEDSAIQEIRSPSHPIAVAFGRTSTSESQPPHLSRASATLSLGTSTLDKDIVLEIMHQVRYIGVNPSYSRPLFGSSGIFGSGKRVPGSQTCLTSRLCVLQLDYIPLCAP